jgi:hypothetical protein
LLAVTTPPPAKSGVEEPARHHPAKSTRRAGGHARGRAYRAGKSADILFIIGSEKLRFEV